MSGTENGKPAGKEALQRLREARKQLIENAVRRMKVQRKAVDTLKRILQDGAKTVPELAAAAGLGTAETMWYVATLKKYGEIAEGEKDGGYFRYELAGEAAGPTPDAIIGKG